MIDRIEDLVRVIICALDEEREPCILPFNNAEEEIQMPLARNSISKRSFLNLSQSRSFSSLLMVLSFVHSLLLSNRTTTTREVYYFYVTHFRNQKECDGIIFDAARLLGVSRVSLGLSASPKGWYCGRVKIKRGTKRDGREGSESFWEEVEVDGTCTPSSVQGMPITREWIKNHEGDANKTLTIESDAYCILVIEKEGIYSRLSEDKFFDKYPCILLTGRGFPDLATRAFVHSIHTHLGLPVYGVCDCNPCGINVLSTYRRGGKRLGVDQDRYNVPIQWLGLRPSHLDNFGDDQKLPSNVYQEMTSRDRQVLKSLYHESSLFANEGSGRRDEFFRMEQNGFKVELEALMWLGMDFLANWMHGELQACCNEGFPTIMI